MSNPFDWKNYTSKIDWSDLRLRGQQSATSSKHVDKKRAAGIEPSPIHALSNRPSKHQLNPKKFAIKK